jgi:hypothetical protein
MPADYNRTCILPQHIGKSHLKDSLNHRGFTEEPAATHEPNPHTWRCGYYPEEIQPSANLPK